MGTNRSNSDPPCLNFLPLLLPPQRAGGRRLLFGKSRHPRSSPFFLGAMCPSLSFSTFCVVVYMCSFVYPIRDRGSGIFVLEEVLFVPLPVGDRNTRADHLSKNYYKSTRSPERGHSLSPSFYLSVSIHSVQFRDPLFLLPPPFLRCRNLHPAMAK